MDLAQHIRESLIVDEQAFRRNAQSEADRIRHHPQEWNEDRTGGGSPQVFFINPYQSYGNAHIIFQLFGARCPTPAQYKRGEIWIEMLQRAESNFCAALTKMMAIPGVSYSIDGTEGDGSDYCLWLNVSWDVGTLDDMRKLTNTVDGYHLLQQKDGQDWYWNVTEEPGAVSMAYEIHFGIPDDPYDHWTYPTWDAFVADQMKQRPSLLSRDDWMAIPV